MATAHLLKESFNGGELSPLMASRVSSEVYQSGVASMENFLPRVQGGAFKRPGLEYVGQAKDLNGHRLHGFKRSTETNYVMEFGGNYIRLWTGGDTPGPELSLVAGLDFWSGSNSGGAWATATGYVLGVKRTNRSIVFICTQSHTSGASNEPGVGADWAQFWAEIPYYEIGDQVRNGSTGYYCKTRHYPSTTFAADAAYWHAYDGDIFEIPTPYASNEVFDLQFTQLNDVLFIAHPNHYPKRLSRINSSRWVFEDVPFEFAPVLDVNEERTNVQVQFDGIPAFGVPWVTATPYQAGDRVHGITGTAQGDVFECILGHTSAAADEPGIGVNTATYWTLILNGGYTVGYRVTAVDIGSTTNEYSNQVFTCHTAYNPATTANDEPGIGTNWRGFWNEGTSSIKIESWAVNTSYVQGTKVRYGKKIYECLRTHKSAAPTYGKPGVTLTQGNKPEVSTGWARYWRISASDTDLSGLGFALFATDDLFTADDVGTIWLLEFGVGGIVADIQTPAVGSPTSTENNPLFIQGGYSVKSTWNDGDAMRGTVSVEESLDGVVWSLVRQFTQLNAKEGNFDVSFEAPPTGAWYRISAKATVNSTAISRIKIEATSSVIKLPFKITSYEEPTKVLGNIQMPADQLPPPVVIGVATSIFRKPAFSETNGYPRAVAFHDSRLWWGGTAAHPARMWASHVEDFYIYLTGTLDTDGLDLTLAAIESNSIQWMASFNRALVISTTGDEWTIDSGEVDSALTPTNIRARRRTRFGSNGVAPQLTGDALLWIQRGGNKLREFAYNFQKDGFDAPDLSVLAEHMLSGNVTQLAFQNAPEPILWLVDGNYLYSFSYNREQAVTAWAKHIILGTADTVTVIYGTAETGDEVWVGGGTSALSEGPYICRLNPSTFQAFLGPSNFFAPTDEELCFADFAVYKTGTYNAIDNTTEFSGLDHLSLSYEFNPGTLQFLPAGEPVSAVSFSGGVVAFPGNLIHKTGWIGIAYTSYLCTMDLHTQLQNGSTFARPFRVNRVDLNLWKSLRGEVGFFIPQSDPYLTDIEYNTLNDQASSARSFTGKTDTNAINTNWDKSLRVVIQSNEIVPFNVLSILLKVEIEEK